MTQLESPAAAPSTGPALTADERAELVRLRRELETVRTTEPRPRQKFRWRSVLAIVLIVLGCALTPVAVVSVWTNNQVSNTDRFVRTVSPLIADPDVQNALTNRLTATVFQYVDVQGISDQAIDVLAQQGLPPQLVDRLKALTPTLASATANFVRDQIAKLVASPQFASAWNAVIRTAHKQMVTVLSGNSQAIVVRGDTVYLDLAPFIDLAKKRLSTAGLTVVNQIPDVHPTVALTKADTLVRAQTAYTTLNRVAGVLPWVVLLLFATGIYLARNRFRALVGTGLGIVLALLLLAVGLLVARGILVDAVPPRAAPATASGFDIVVTYLRLGLRTLMVLGLVLALGGFLAGRSDTAVGIRRWTAGQLHRIRGGPSASGPVATWVRGHVRGLRIGAVALAVLVFVFLSQPTGAAILIIATVLLLVLAVIEFLARPAPADAPPADDAPPPDDDVPPAGDVPVPRADVGTMT
jgi:hypothetical protein